MGLTNLIVKKNKWTIYEKKRPRKRNTVLTVL
jgi:hypothetical protein